MIEPITDINELIDYCLIRLGQGAIKINVTPEQCLLRAYDALMIFSKYHFEAITETQYPVQIIPGQRVYTIDKDILTVTKIIPESSLQIEQPFFNIHYEFWEERYKTGNLDISGYEMMMQKLALIDNKFRDKMQFRFNSMTHQIEFYSIDPSSTYILLNVTKINDHDKFLSMLNNDWLKDYLESLIQIQWGRNLTKYTNMPLPGGQTLNGTGILNEGLMNKEKLEEKLINNYAPIGAFFMA